METVEEKLVLERLAKGWSIEKEIRMAAPIIGVYEGLISLRVMVESQLADPNRDQMPYNPTQNLTLYALYAESYLGRLLLEYKKQAIKASESRTVPRGISKETADEAMLLYEHEENIAGVFEFAVMNGEVMTREMVINI